MQEETLTIGVCTAPEPKSLASVVTKILCSGMRVESMLVRQSEEVTRPLMASKAA